MASQDEDLRQRGLQTLQAGCQVAKAYGARVCLVVAGLQEPETEYVRSYATALDSLRAGAEYAADLGVIIGVENVPSNFSFNPILVYENEEPKMKSRCVVFPEPGKVEVWEEDVTPPGPGEVLCAAMKSLISIGTETYCLRGVFDPGTNWGEWVQFPFRAGYSMAAQVIAVGHGVTDLKEGDRVAGWIVHQGFFRAQPDQLYSVPDGVSDEEATWNCLAVTTQLGVRRAQHSLGENVGVVGLGMLGQLVVQYLVLSGARKIVAIDPVQSRLDMAQAHGATHTLALDVRQARSAIDEITAGKMLDVIYEITGHPAVLAPCIPLVRKLGRIVLLGDTPTPTQQCLGPGVVSDSIAILGIHGSMTPAQPSEFNPWTRRECVMLFFDYLLQGRMKVSDLITHRYSPMRAPEVYAGLVQDRSASVGNIFDWNLL